MQKSKNCRTKKIRSKKRTTQVSSVSSNELIEYSPNAKYLATLINANDLNDLSFFIKELCNESKLTFHQYYQEWFDIFINNIQKDLNLAKLVAKDIYYNNSDYLISNRSVHLNKIISEYVWSNCTTGYKKDCILSMSLELFDLDLSASDIEKKCFLDSIFRYMELLSTIKIDYKNTVLQSIVDRQNVQRKVANF